MIISLNISPSKFNHFMLEVTYSVNEMNSHKKHFFEINQRKKIFKIIVWYFT